jgi:hypothetical protein
MTHVLDPLEVSAIHRVEVKFLDVGRSRGSQLWSDGLFKISHVSVDYTPSQNDS